MQSQNECELEIQLLDLDPLSEPILTSRSLLDLSLIPESVSVHIPPTPEPKSIIYLNHIPFWNKGDEQNDSEMIYQIGSVDGDKFHNKQFHINIIIVGYNKREVTTGFLRTPHSLDWATFHAPIRPPPEPPP